MIYDDIWIYLTYSFIKCKNIRFSVKLSHELISTCTLCTADPANSAAGLSTNWWCFTLVAELIWSSTEPLRFGINIVPRKVKSWKTLPELSVTYQGKDRTDRAQYLSVTYWVKARRKSKDSVSGNSALWASCAKDKWIQTRYSNLRWNTSWILWVGIQS